MEMDSEATTMSFVMPSSYDMDDLPDPVNAKIKMHETGSRITASIRFSGYANDEKIQTKINELKQILESKGLKYEGEFSYLGYNPPYQVVNRRNEILVTLVDYPVN
jgi:hypothetical protein